MIWATFLKLVQGKADSYEFGMTERQRWPDGNARQLFSVRVPNPES
jgi:hypothetical protein